ncbi:MAG: hypothetical protein AUI14_14240 [Actinobacteria bacterium 13_2_20CM_2_71_6]|nr:MAG: hypothetical protein AUI14_14240 [Actinobacteria bacterium 13_2_20CM_2_71_6]
MLRALAIVSAILGLAASPASATTTVPLGTHAAFGGTVNGSTAHAAIRMACFGPEWPGRTGHPMAGQRVGVFIPEAMTQPTFGRTGDPARAIVVSIVTARGAVGPVARFRRLLLTRPVISANRPLPTWLTLPCSGHATVVFTPVPATAGAKPATVEVTFAGQP